MSGYYLHLKNLMWAIRQNERYGYRDDHTRRALAEVGSWKPVAEI